MQDDIAKALYNLTMATTAEKYLLTQITSTIKQLEDKKISTVKINTLTVTNVYLAAHGGNQNKQSRIATTVNDYESKLYPTGYLWTHGCKVDR